MLKLAGAAVVVFAVAIAALYLCQRRLVFPAPPARAIAVPGYARVVLHTVDGLALTALYRPALPGKATILFFHGNADTLEGSAAAVAGPVAAGHGALLPEYRGYGGNAGSPGETGLYADGAAALAFLRQHGIADRAIVIIGNSIGSGVATEVATHGDFGGLALISAYTRLPDVVRDLAFGLPLGFLVRDRFDNLARLPAVTAPVLVLHGRRDRTIGFDHGVALGAVPGVRFLAFDAGHELAYLPQAQAALVAWLAERRQPTPVAATALQ